MPETKPPIDRVMHLFEHKLGLHVPHPDADLLGGGIVDSLAFVNMLLQLESEFGVRVSLEDVDLENFRSASRIAEFVAERTGGPAREKTGWTGGRHARR